MATRPPPHATATDNTMLHVVYGLFALSFLIGIASIAAVVIAYLQRGKALSEMQPRMSSGRSGRSGGAAVRCRRLRPVDGSGGAMLIGMLAFGLVLVWYLYRIAKGWLWLKDGRTIDDPTALI